MTLITDKLTKIPEPTDARYTCSNTGGVEHEVGEFLYGLVRMIKPKAILETGTHHGISASYMAQALIDNGREGILTTIEFIVENHVKANLVFEELKLQGQIESLLMPVEEFKEGDKQYDLIFLDTEPQTRFQEFLRFWKNLKPGGFMIIHDLNPCLGQTGIEINGMKDWPFGTMPQEMKELITSHQLQSIHPRTPRGFYLVQKTDTDFYSTKLLCETK